MSRDVPDIGTLDALVLGTDEPEDITAWKWLVATPGAAQVWSEAVARRAEVDRFAEALEAHPWIATMMDRVRRLGRALMGVRLEVTREDEAFAAVLAPSMEEPALLAAPAWGRIEPVTAPPGTIVELRVLGDAHGAIHFFYRQASGQEGPLPERRWKLEEGEAPVLLIACATEGQPWALDEALTAGASMAGVLLLAP
jgi:hypothetical protein